MMKNINKIITGLCLFAIVSCSSDDEMPNKISGIENIKVDKVLLDGKLFADFVFENGLPARIDLYNPIENEIYMSKFLYFENKKLTQVRDVSCCETRIHDFTYEDDNIVKSYQTRLENNYESYELYSYENGLIKDISEFEVGETSEWLASKTEFRYEGGKLTELYYPIHDRLEIVTVDDEKNPFYGLPNIIIYDIFSYPIRSQPIPNNITSFTYPSGGGHDFQLKYNEEGYPISAVTRNGYEMNFIYLD